MAVVVGQGLWDYITANGDSPVEDSAFHANRDGSQTERVWGTKGYYIAENSSGTWKVHGPFGGDGR